MSATILLNGDEVYLEELVRENARLTIQHSADHQRIKALLDQVAILEADKQSLSARAEQAEENLSQTTAWVRRENELSAKLDQAIKDLHFVMADGDACQVCKNKCPMGTKDCKPLWKGLEGREEAQ